MSADDSFRELFEKLCRNDNDAAVEVVHRYAERLIALVRSRLDQRLKQRLDPEDVIQSVFRTFFVRLANGRFQLRDWNSLWGLLVCITVRKCISAYEHHHAAVRDVDREAHPAAPGQQPSSWVFLDRSPDPSDSALLEEALEKALEGLKEQEVAVVILSLQGLEPAEVARQLRCSASKVYRVLGHVRGRLQKLRDAELPC
jgi:RNA polymerase sigma-70 factor (ECF subfamily)